MKSYTDLGQSKKLAEILPLESADMWYHGHYSPWNSEREYDDEPCPFHSMRPNWDKQCWSLAALLSVLPSIEGFKPVIDLDINQIRYEGKYRDELIVHNENLIDACYTMILKLYELKLL